MSPETLQVASLVAAGVVVVAVPLIIFLLASRIRNAAHESVEAALHWRVTLRDANAAVDRAREYQALNELYCTDPVRDAVDNVRRQVEMLSFSLTREQQPADREKRNAQQDSLHSAVTSLLHAMRDDLRSNGAEVKPRPRAELDRPASRGTLPVSAGMADKAPAPLPG